MMAKVKGKLAERRAKQIEMMIDLHKQGKTLREIADTFEVRACTVADRLAAAGVRLKRAPRESGSPYSPEEMQEIRAFSELPWNVRRIKDLMSKLPGRTRSGVEIVLRRLKNAKRTVYAERPIAVETNKLDVPAGYYRASNGVVLKHLSIQGDMSRCYKRPEVVG